MAARSPALVTGGYNRLRASYATGPDAEVRALAQELQAISGFDPGWLKHTVSARVLESWQTRGEAATLAALDGAYRTGTWGSADTPHTRPPRWRGAAGFAAYYLPKLPYMARKVRAEHHAEWSGGELVIEDVTGN